MENQQNFKSWSSAMNNVRRQKKTFDENRIVIHPSVFIKMDEFAVKQKWKEVVGPLFARSATAISYANNILCITINSSAIKSELMMNKSTIINRINQEMGKIAVKDIFLK